MTTQLRLSLCTLALAGAIGCGDTIVNYPSPTQPTDTRPTTVTSVVTFRVVGNATSAKIRYSTPQDGLVQTTSTLPFFTSFSTTSDNMFLSLEVTPISFSALVNDPFLSAQILVNNNLFREATSTDWLLFTISVNGTWRR